MKIEINKPVIREAVVRAISDEQINNREVEFVISDETPDSFGTVFKISSWDLTRYVKNPLVLYVHKSNSENPDMVVGVSTLRIDNNQLIGTAVFEPADINPTAEKIFRKIIHGTLRMASVGALPKRGHWGDKKLGEDPDLLYFDEVELLEWSIVPVGSNPDALKRESQTIEEIRNSFPKDIPAGKGEKLSVRERQLIINSNKK